MRGKSPTPQTAFQFSLAWLLAYITIMGLVSGGLIYSRSQALAIYGSETAQENWDAWRENAKAMAHGTGPVKRREPRSVRPPALVLMQDYFVICLVGAVLLTTVLFGTFMFFVRGAFSPAGEFVDRSQEVKSPRSKVQS